MMLVPQGLREVAYYKPTMSFFTGMFAAQAAAVFTNPIDVVKTRLQIQGEGTATGMRKTGLFKMFGKIASEEGLFALQKGLVPSLLRETFYSSIRLSAYEPIRNLIMTDHEKKHGASLAKKFAAGGTAGAIGAGIANPADLIKVRMQAASSKAYPSTWSAVQQVYREEGFTGLYRGVGPTVQRAAILTATQLGTYDHIKHFILDLEVLSEGTLLHFCSGTVAGLAVAITTSPVDTVKTRVMNQPRDKFGKGMVYRGQVDCFRKTVAAEGFVGLYKGFTAQWMRVGPHTTISLVVWEHLRLITGLHAI